MYGGIVIDPNNFRCFHCAICDVYEYQVLQGEHLCWVDPSHVMKLTHNPPRF
jgi:hypothetical protein